MLGSMIAWNRYLRAAELADAGSCGSAMRSERGLVGLPDCRKE